MADEIELGDEPAFSTKKFAFQAMLEKAANVVPHRDVLPVLKNFLVEVHPDKIRVAATDLELSIVVSSELVLVQRPGMAVLPAERMLRIVREASEGDLVIDVKSGEADIRVGNYHGYIKLQSADEFPALPAEGGGETVTVDRVDFLSAITTVRHSASQESTRPSLMLLDVTDGRMRASDGVRFQQVEVAGLPDMQIPINAVSDLVKVLKATETAKIEIGQDEDSLIFFIGLDEFVAQKPTTIFPDVDAGLLKPAMANDQQLSVDRTELVDAIKRVRITADPETSAVVLTLSPTTVVVTSKDKHGSRAEEPVTAVWTGPERSVTFNHGHLTELLNSMSAKSVTARLGKDESKTRPSNLLIIDEEAGMTAVLTQLRLDWVE